MLSALSSLAITLGLLVLALHLLRRVQRAAGQGGALPLAILQRLPLGQRQQVLLVRVGGRVLVLAEHDGQTALLTELAGDDLAAALAADGDQPAPAPAFRIPGLTRAAAVALALLLPAAATAQQAPAPATPPAATAPAAGAVPAGPPQGTAVSVGKPVPVQAAPAAPRAGGLGVQAPGAPQIELAIGGPGEQLKISGAVGLVLFMGAMTLLPAIILLCTSFTRILIVLHFLRSALGTQTTPPGQLLVAIAVLLTGVVMQPTLETANSTALQPYLNGQLTQVEAYQAAVKPLRDFMLANTRESDLATFTEISRVTDAATIDDVPTMTVVGAFVTSELRTAFQMGFVIFLPFVVIDLVVSSVLMGMGMFMLPPVMVSLPFKLLLFVLADGWTLVVRNVVASFNAA